MLGGIICAAVAINRAIAVRWPDVHIPGATFSMLTQNGMWAYAMELGTGVVVTILMGMAKVQADSKSIETSNIRIEQLRKALRGPKAR